MIIVDGLPPNYAEIVERIPSAANKGVVFTYGQTLYAPGRKHIGKPLMIHEETHAGRQGPTEGTARSWWRDYLNSQEFRFHEELLAHRAELKEYQRTTKDRNKLAWHFHDLAVRLSSPLYGNIITYTEARRALTDKRYILN